MSVINKSCFVGIISCQKYTERRQLQKLENCPFEYKYFIGRNEVQETIDDNVVILDCEDNYESLPIKVKKMFEWILNNKSSINFVFKTDDDIIFNFDKLYEQFLKVESEKIDYAGHIVHLKSGKSSYHFGKCENEELNKLIDMESTSYCAGGGYFLSKKSLQIVTNQIEIYQNIFEDYSVGRTLNQNNIYPYDINLYKNSCYW